MAIHEEIQNKVEEYIEKECGDVCKIQLCLLEQTNDLIVDGDYNIDDLNKSVTNGKCVFIRLQNTGGIPYISPVLTSPTYLELSYYANDSIYHIEENGNIDHIYLESIDNVGSLDFGRIHIYEMHFGS